MNCKELLGRKEFNRNSCALDTIGKTLRYNEKGRETTRARSQTLSFEHDAHAWLAGCKQGAMQRFSVQCPSSTQHMEQFAERPTVLEMQSRAHASPLMMHEIRHFCIDFFIVVLVAL